jgi:hypothetical protein
VLTRRWPGRRPAARVDSRDDRGSLLRAAAFHGSCIGRRWCFRPTSRQLRDFEVRRYRLRFLFAVFFQYPGAAAGTILLGFGGFG